MFFLGKKWIEYLVWFAIRKFFWKVLNQNKSLIKFQYMERTSNLLICYFHFRNHVIFLTEKFTSIPNLKFYFALCNKKTRCSLVEQNSNTTFVKVGMFFFFFFFSEEYFNVIQTKKNIVVYIIFLVPYCS